MNRFFKSIISLDWFFGPLDPEARFIVGMLLLIGLALIIYALFDAGIF